MSLHDLPGFTPGVEAPTTPSAEGGHRAFIDRKRRFLVMALTSGR